MYYLYLTNQGRLFFANSTRILVKSETTSKQTMHLFFFSIMELKSSINWYEFFTVNSELPTEGDNNLRKNLDKFYNGEFIYNAMGRIEIASL